jgi:hypothetical protein
MTPEYAPSVLKGMTELAIIWIVPALAVCLLLLAAIAAILWMFRDRTPQPQDQTPQPRIEWRPCPICNGKGCGLCRYTGTIATPVRDDDEERT